MYCLFSEYCKTSVVMSSYEGSGTDHGYLIAKENIQGNTDVLKTL